MRSDTECVQTLLAHLPAHLMSSFNTKKGGKASKEPPPPVAVRSQPAISGNVQQFLYTFLKNTNTGAWVGAEDLG